METAGLKKERDIAYCALGTSSEQLRVGRQPLLSSIPRDQAQTGQAALRYRLTVRNKNPRTSSVFRQEQDCSHNAHLKIRADRQIPAYTWGQGVREGKLRAGRETQQRRTLASEAQAGTGGTGTAPAAPASGSAALPLPPPPLPPRGWLRTAPQEQRRRLEHPSSERPFASCGGAALQGMWPLFFL